LDETIEKMLDLEQGRLKHVDESFQRQIDSLDKSATRLNKLFDLQRTRLETEFASLESTIASLQTTSSFLGAQLTNLIGLRQT
jgi:flagellar capping protein FliD